MNNILVQLNLPQQCKRLRMFVSLDVMRSCVVCMLLTLLGAESHVAFAPPARLPYKKNVQSSRTASCCQAAIPSWSELESTFLSDAYHKPARSLSIDSVLQPDRPAFSTTRPTLFRERHGWCPYSERVWLALELSGADYDTVRIDNTGHGPRPSYFAGQTPQVRWPERDRFQGESMDLVGQVDARYCNGALRSEDSTVRACIGQFSNIFPRARPSSRAAFLFQYNGEPLWRSTFEETLQGVDDLLQQTNGPFLCGGELTAADIAWAPFLERYRYQLPCLHKGLQPYHESTYPHLFAWYQAMDKVPAYACRVKGDASSWRKVLTMAGFGNAGVPPTVVDNMQELEVAEAQAAARAMDPASNKIWDEYAATRPHVAETPRSEAASVVARNRHAIQQDTLKRAPDGIPQAESQVDETVRGLVSVLLSDEVVAEDPQVRSLALFLDERMCVPRDMGCMSAACIKWLAYNDKM